MFLNYQILSYGHKVILFIYLLACDHEKLHGAVALQLQPRKITKTTFTFTQ